MNAGVTQMKFKEGACARALFRSNLRSIRGHLRLKGIVRDPRASVVNPASDEELPVARYRLPAECGLSEVAEIFPAVAGGSPAGAGSLTTAAGDSPARADETFPGADEAATGADELPAGADGPFSGADELPTVRNEPPAGADELPSPADEPPGTPDGPSPRISIRQPAITCYRPNPFHRPSRSSPSTGTR